MNTEDIKERNFSLEEKILGGTSYAEFQKSIEAKLSADPGNEKLRLNYQRMKRLGTVYEVSDEIKAILAKISSPQTWIVITEDWCGDSAQTLPVLSIIAEAGKLITLKVIGRDMNLDMMDHYLTNGGRSIPVLVAFDEDGKELFRWGPRPAEAQKLVQEAKAAGIPSSEYNRDLHSWYAKDKGKSTEREIAERLSR